MDVTGTPLNQIHRYQLIDSSLPYAVGVGYNSLLLSFNYTPGVVCLVLVCRDTLSFLSIGLPYNSIQQAMEYQAR
jgi:hypothetical protein